LLERAATPANCFTLLHLADHCRLPSLAAAAEAVALANFAGACELDESGFLGLPMELLSSVLSSDYLVAANELQVFGAVATWVTADKPHRLPHFHKLLGEHPSSASEHLVCCYTLPKKRLPSVQADHWL
jgi:hypothetical protein